MMERRRICKALVRFAQRTPLQRAVAYHLAAYLPVTELRRAAESFKRVDTAQSGHLSYDEIASALKEVLGLERHQGLLVAQAMDTDRSERLDFQEFSAALAMVSGAAAATRRGFPYHDKNPEPYDKNKIDYDKNW